MFNPNRAKSLVVCVILALTSSVFAQTRIVPAKKVVVYIGIDNEILNGMQMSKDERKQLDEVRATARKDADGVKASALSADEKKAKNKAIWRECRDAIFKILSPGQKEEYTRLYLDKHAPK